MSVHKRSMEKQMPTTPQREVVEEEASRKAAGFIDAAAAVGDLFSASPSRWLDSCMYVCVCVCVCV